MPRSLTADLDEGYRRRVGSDLPRQPLGPSSLNAGELFDGLRRVIRQALQPPRQQRASMSGGFGRPDLFGQDHVSQTQGQHAFSSGADGNPLISAGAGRRHARFHLHQLAAGSRAPLSQLAVPDGLRDG